MIGAAECDIPQDDAARIAQTGPVTGCLRRARPHCQGVKGDLRSRWRKGLPITGSGSKRRKMMSAGLSPIDKAKFVAAKRAVEFVENGMRVGLGTGSTAAWMVRILGQRVREERLRIKGVATSARTAQLAREEGIEVVSLDEARWLDLTIDGTDEFDPELNLIKGGGAALLHEKIVATASDRMIVIADAAKEVAHLGAFPLPVEVIPFGWQTTKALIEEMLVSLDVLGREVTLRTNGASPLVTEQGNRILDLHLGRVGNARQMALVLNQVPGVVENGLFIDICDRVIVGHGDGRVTTRDIYTGEVEQDRYDFAEPENLFADLTD
jgi:ribose 5-phosphate isomerase A